MCSLSICIAHENIVKYKLLSELLSQFVTNLLNFYFFHNVLPFKSFILKFIIFPNF